jgi:subtilisin family serine protease
MIFFAINLHAQSSPNLYDTINGNLVEKKVLLLWIQPQFTDSVNINDTNRVIRTFSDFVNDDFIDSIPLLLIDFTRADAYKIFPQLTENDTVSISRGGWQVGIPPFYTALHVFFTDEGSNIEQIFDSLVHRGNIIRGIEYNGIMEYAFTPDDPFYCNAQKSLHDTGDYCFYKGDYNINATQAWDYSVGEKYIRVGIHDTGIKWNHNDFYFSTGQSKITEGYNYADPGTPCLDYAGHGTMMAGIIGAVTDNVVGIAGIAGGRDPKIFGASIVSH